MTEPADNLGTVHIIGNSNILYANCTIDMGPQPTGYFRFGGNGACYISFPWYKKPPNRWRRFWYWALLDWRFEKEPE